MAVEFQDFSIEVKAALEDAVEEYLETAGSEMKSQVQREQTRVDSGQTKGAWTHIVDSSAKKVTIGNPLENSIWEEFGTGEYSLKGGRKGGWYVPGDKLTSKAKAKMRKVTINGKEFYFTKGKKPIRPLHNAFTANKGNMIRLAERILKGRMG